MVAIMLLSSCYPIRRVGLLQDREGLPEYEKGEYEKAKPYLNNIIFENFIPKK